MKAKSVPSEIWCAEVQVAAVAEDDRERDGGEQVDEREVDAVEDDRLHVRLAVAQSDRTEVRVRGFLARERLHDAHAGDVLRQRRGDEPEPLAHVRVRARGVPAEDDGRDAHERDDRACREREPPVEDEQQHGRADERERALHERRHAVGDELVDRLHVVREAADDHARPVALVEAEREPLQVREELVAQVGEDPLPDPAGEVRLDVRHAPVRETGGDEDADDELELRAGVPVDRVVERVLRQVRRRERRQRRGQKRDDGEPGASAVGARQAPQRPETATRRAPRPVVHLRAALLRQVTSRLDGPSCHFRPCLDGVRELLLEHAVLVDLAVDRARTRRARRACRARRCARPRGRRSRPRARSSRGDAR